MTNSLKTADRRGLAASTVLLCTGAAAGVSGFGGLLVTVFGAWLLLILSPLARLFRPTRRPINCDASGESAALTSISPP